MANLQEGHQYSLSNENENNKSLIFVKLTDSALKAIETYLCTNNGSSCKPTIQFQNSNGIISLPLNGMPFSYEFTLSKIEGDKAQSSFQCVQHVGGSSLESLGFMFMKMQIHATEDSYETTKSKMAAADQEQKKLCTKELQQNITRLGTKGSVRRPGLMYIPEKIPSSAVKLEPTKFNLKNKVTSPATFIQRPIRQRVIHILAAKAYKRAELILRLKKEGLNEKDKEQINDILIEVGKLKGNVYSLEDHIWNEVQEDWEFSSKEELQLIKKKKQQFLKSKNINGVTGNRIAGNGVTGKQITGSRVIENHIIENGVTRNHIIGSGVTENHIIGNRVTENHITESGVTGNHVTENGITGSRVTGNGITGSGVTGNGITGSGVAGNQITEIGVTGLSKPNVKQKSKLSMVEKTLSSKKLFNYVNEQSCQSIEKPNLLNNGISLASKRQSVSSNNVDSLPTSFVLQQHKAKETNGLKKEDICMEIASNDTHIGQNVLRPSNHMTPNTVSLYKQTECSNVSKIQVKQSNNYSETNMNRNLFLLQQTAREHIRLHYQKSKDCSLKSPNETVQKTNELNGSCFKAVPLPKLCTKFDFSEIYKKYTKIESLEQRSQYASEFDNDYKEYAKLQAEMVEISKKSLTLNDEITAYAEEFPQNKKIKIEYDRASCDSYIVSRKRFEFLKTKLSCIRDLILEYDKSIESD